MFHIGAVQYGSHQTQVAMGPEDNETQELKLKLYLMLTNLNLNNHMRPLATLLNSTAVVSGAVSPGFSWWGDGCLPKCKYIETDEK